MHAESYLVRGKAIKPWIIQTEPKGKHVSHTFAHIYACVHAREATHVVEHVRKGKALRSIEALST